MRTTHSSIEVVQTGHCCETMREQVEFVCDDHPSRHDCPDALIHFSQQFREYGLVVHDGGTSSQSIAYCPWCGTKLPESLRSRWFAELEAQGIDPIADDVPELYRSDHWYRVLFGH